MGRLVVALIAIATICVPVSSVFSRGTQPLDKEDLKRRSKHSEVYRFNLRGLIEATLTKSKDLGRKGKNTYFCEYDNTAEPKPCDRMDTVSGQYEDYYQSQMVCKERCPRADTSQSSWIYITGKKRICRDLASGSCEKIALTVDQMREELIGLLELEEQMKGASRSPAANPEQPSQAGDQ
jgi:hypothetical protein